ncbi:TetR family transcriptional regulator [Leucobacter coleopterorum]|uniref:TetR family transcriptional regulator n=1 Tax=Leucobacter coleopterorum TaxID=2714933 RepID=A0ABX6JXE1_9MICO|nr:TetR/AcrR family transcriptional regulator [Leucobacter coleopterorum]QIM18996.1 TetR family transcriptional regulator [Leucobacter coleopterorum]
MATKQPSTATIRRDAPENSVAAIRRLTEQGYDSTTAEDLADAVGMSRSTFFRRFGSKDDVVFADHDHALAQLEHFLESTSLPPSDAVVEGTADVLRLLVRDPEAARLRFELMRLTPALRDRELVITHRYERVFANYLRTSLPAESAAWVSAAIAASLVAVHNTTLRQWLRDPHPDIVPQLCRELRQLVSAFAPWFFAPGPSEGTNRVMVAVYDTAASPEGVLSSVAAVLDAQ